MKFAADGPSIPDELLIARDQGRVVFFCGAGVSLARAHLPDFFGLAEKVTTKLGVQADSPVVKILAEAKVIGGRTGVDGLISADRVFGLLEREFLPQDINAAVASALNPGADCDLRAHKTLIQLATTREGLVRLVTTNFDRLFDQCKDGIKSFQPPNLPNPLRPADLNGIVYLHGKATENYDGAEGDGFVLSSSEFGRAYLSDGWATAFIREIIDRYFVVFVGYTADDPPVQYLLEALNKTTGTLERVYAFQSGDANYAMSRWQHKGVQAIPYDNANGHAALWNTLEGWAERAIDPEGWMSRIVDQAGSGPDDLEPYQRGQVAHLMGTLDGVKKFTQGQTLPPASWLCVFDHQIRFEKPGHKGRLREKGPYVDPFDLYGLDSDVIPNKVDPEDNYAKREIPTNAWSAFALNKWDHQNLRDENVSSLRGYWAANIPRLPPRLSHLGVWIRRVAHQPAAVWWAARQISLHPDLREQIIWDLEQDETISTAAVRTAWRHLFEYWSSDRSDFSQRWYGLASDIKKNGWSGSVVRRFAQFGRPFMKVETNYWGGPVPPPQDCELADIIRLDVGYPDNPGRLEIPDNWLPQVVVQLRKNLEIAIDLENELGGFGLNHVSPITPDDESDGQHYGRNQGLSGWILHYVSLLNKLALLDAQAAINETNRWPVGDGSVFSRLWIWAAGNKTLVSDDKFGQVLEGIPNKAFWDSYHTRDLLLTLSSRWNGLEVSDRMKIEQRIILGPSSWDNEAQDEYIERKAWAVLNRLHWLQNNDCILQTKISSLTNKLQRDAPKWRPEFAAGAARSLEGRSGWIRTETDPSTLVTEPLETILDKALELSRSKGIEFVERDPFAGLAAARPIKALSSLRKAANKKFFPEWAWRAFLNAEQRKGDKPKLTAFIAQQIVRFSPEDIAGFVRPVADWCQKSAKVLAGQYPHLFPKLIDKVIDALALIPTQGASVIVRGNRDADWTMEAINSPTGDLAEALFDDPRKDNLKVGHGFPEGWQQHAERMLTLPNDLRRHALVIFVHDLNWFFSIDPEWTNQRLLNVLTQDNEEDKLAFWSGLLWGGTVHGHGLFMILKPHLLSLAKSGDVERRGHAEALTGLILSAWGVIEEKTGQRWIANDELRDVLLHSDDEVRTRFLWQANHWSSYKDDSSKWSTLLVELIKDVWPRQLAAKSAAVTARLCELAFSNEERFAELAPIILPLLTKIDVGHLTLPILRRSKDNIADLHPDLTLALLHAVLPGEADRWPYGIESTLIRIGTADSSLNGDERLLELRRIWNSR